MGRNCSRIFSSCELKVLSQRHRGEQHRLSAGGEGPRGLRAGCRRGGVRSGDSRSDSMAARALFSPVLLGRK